MVTNIKVNLVMDYIMDKEYLSILQEIFMKVIMYQVKKKEKESLLLIILHNMKDNGQMIIQEKKVK